MKRFSAVVVDDEPLARKRLCRLLDSERDIDVVGECSNGREAISVLSSQSPDLVFLDVQMPEMDGFAVLRALAPKRIPAVVFVTAYDDYALEAFNVNALDYLLKPFDKKRFQESVERARGRLSEHREETVSGRLTALLENLSAAPASRGRIAVKTGGKVMFVNTSDIDWIEAADNYACLHCSGVTHVLRETMSSLETRLDRKMFLRIHRSIIVNVDRIAEMQPWFRGDYLVILKDGTKLKLSRTHREALAGTLLNS
jgi:two-component system, LytTR family, response regulator